VRDKLKEEMGLFPGHRFVADLIDQDEGRFEVAPPSALTLRVPVLFQFLDQITHGSAVDGHAGIAGLDQKGGRQVGLSHPRRPKKDDVFLLLKEVEIKKCQDLTAVVQTQTPFRSLLLGLDEETFFFNFYPSYEVFSPC